MKPSWQLALNSLAGRPRRTLLICGTAVIACALIVMLTSGFYSAQTSLEMQIDQLIGSADARVVHQFNNRFSVQWLDTINDWPEVEDTLGSLVSTLTISRSEDNQEDQNTQTVLATGVDLDRFTAFRDIVLKSGQMPAHSGEAILDSAIAEELHIEVGDHLQIQHPTDQLQIVITGIYDQNVLLLQQQSLIFLDRQTLAHAVDLSGQVSSILIRLGERIDIDAFCQQHIHELPATLTLEPSERARAGFDRQVQIGNVGLLHTTVMTVIGASIIMIIGLTVGVLKQQRELAVIRAIGADKQQLVIAQLFTGLFIAVVGIIGGVPLGIALAAVTVAFFRDYLPGDFQISYPGVILAICGTLCAGCIGAVYPAWLAGRVTPLEAMQRIARKPRLRGILICAGCGIFMIVLPYFLRLPEDHELRFWLYSYVSLPLLIVGYFLLTVPMMILLIAALGSPLARILRIPADLLKGTLFVRPFRNGLTASTLMIGIMLLVAFEVVNQSFLSGWVDQIRFADGFAYRISGITKEQHQAIADLPFIDLTCPTSNTQVRIYHQQIFGIENLSSPYVTCIGFEPESFFTMNHVDWIQGDPAQAIDQLNDGNTILVTDRFLTARDIGLGDSLTLGEGRVQREFEIAGVISSPGLDVVTTMLGMQSAYLDYSISCVFMDFDAAGEHFGNRDIMFLQINWFDDVDAITVEHAIRETAPGVMFHSGKWIRTTIHEIVDQFALVEYTIALASLILACLAAGNIIVANIRNRRFEYGIVRAVGGHRSLLFRLVLAEAGMLALCAIIVGLIAGVHLAQKDIVNARDLIGIIVDLVLPWRVGLIGAAITMFLTLLAALPGAMMLLRRNPSSLLHSI